MDDVLPARPATGSSLAVIEGLLASGATSAVVSDLDGVLRVFDPELWAELDERMSVPAGTAFRAILASPVLGEVIRGRMTHARWRERARADLAAAGVPAGQAHDAVARWAAAPARVDPQVRDLLIRAREAGRTVLVLTNGTDRVREEVAALDLAAVIGPEGERLLSSHEIGSAKPEQETYAAAHRRLEELAGAPLAADEVVLLDDSPGNVEAAMAFGWRAVLHEAPGTPRG
ncbi:HAD family hydrolase [Brachybacterium hainanense]|uniref:HAD family hydrolase n=1 Tax=Brachybacterium hainanense TaxID=1541174 RepID=A0ABV6RGA1_9MICO